MKIVISCAPSTSPWLAEEVKALQYPVHQINPTDVVTEGTLFDCMRLNLYLRSAHRVLLILDEFIARTPDHLYRKAKDFPWENHLFTNGYISIDSFVRNEHIRDFRFANLKLKDAIVDRMQELFDHRPDSGKEKDHMVLFMHWVDDKVSLALDTSGQTIAKHGYRRLPWNAPLLESMAAALLLASRWDARSPFVNPMCGSGTLAIEAALMGLKIPPGLYRENFGFMHLRGYKAGQWQELLEEARENQLHELSFPIVASDNEPQAISAARMNARNAGVEKFIDFSVCDFQETPVPQEPGIVMLNPEWGERLGEEEGLRAVYKQIGDFFKSSCKGYWGYIFTGNLKLAKQVGLRSTRRIEFFSSKIESRLLEYELYSGSKKNP